MSIRPTPLLWHPRRENWKSFLVLRQVSEPAGADSHGPSWLVKVMRGPRWTLSRGSLSQGTPQVFCKSPLWGTTPAMGLSIGSGTHCKCLMVAQGLLLQEAALITGAQTPSFEGQSTCSHSTFGLLATCYPHCAAPHSLLACLPAVRTLPALPLPPAACDEHLLSTQLSGRHHLLKEVLSTALWHTAL